MNFNRFFIGLTTKNDDKIRILIEFNRKKKQIKILRCFIWKNLRKNNKKRQKSLDKSTKTAD